MSARFRSRPDPFTRAAVFSVALAALLAAVGAARAADAPSARVPAEDNAVSVNELERAFWYCDYLATTRGARATPVIACRSATEQLKKLKFGGSFERLLAWWRENKPVEHRKLASIEAR